MRRFLLLSLVVLTAPLAAQQATTSAVLVTGASSGIGRKIAEALAARGTFVYAGARKAEDIAELSRIPNMQGVKLDVTVPGDIAAAVETVKKGGRGLHGVVNNAGIAIVGPLIEHEEREMEQIFQVNTLGPWRVTKAFAPMLIESKGRVVTVSSISGILSGGFLGAYSMSKHAIEAFSDAFGAEMRQLGVHSALIEPGNYKSDIGRNTMAQVQAAQARAKGTPFEAGMANMAAAMGRYDSYPEPDSVASAAIHALYDPSPRARYMVVPAANQGLVTVRKAMEEMVQLNAGHQFTLDREALIKMLDEMLARIK
jgi:NAD(P)-dependent dehydrogenase (short-subunit alcohol dehydrogenase family)